MGELHHRDMVVAGTSISTIELRRAMAKKYLLYIHNTKFLNVENKSKLVNELLDGYFAKTDTPKPAFAPQRVQRVDQPTRLQPCCMRAKPCIHWQWNGEDAYINMLSGDKKTV